MQTTNILVELGAMTSEELLARIDETALARALRPAAARRKPWAAGTARISGGRRQPCYC